jgi:hypothetical protein
MTNDKLSDLDKITPTDSLTFGMLMEIIKSTDTMYGCIGAFVSGRPCLHEIELKWSRMSDEDKCNFAAAFNDLIYAVAKIRMVELL